MWVVLPKGAGMQDISFLKEEHEIFETFSFSARGTQPFKGVAYCQKNVKAPNAGHQVEDAELARLIELGVLALGEVETPIDFLRGGRNTTRSRERETLLSRAAVGGSGTGEDSRFYLWLL